MLEVLGGIPRVFARLVSEFGNCRWASLPLYTSIPDLSPLSIGIRVSSILSRTRLAGGIGVSGAGASDLNGAWEMMIAGRVWLLVLWLWWLWWLLVRLRSELVVITGGIDVWGMSCAHVVGDIDQSDSPPLLLRWLRSKNGLRQRGCHVLIPSR